MAKIALKIVSKSKRFSHKIAFAGGPRCRTNLEQIRKSPFVQGSVLGLDADSERLIASLSLSHTQRPSLSHTLTLSHTHSLSFSLSLSFTHTHTHTRRHTHTGVGAGTRRGFRAADCLSLTHIRTHTLSLSHTHALTHTLSLSHTHTHALTGVGAGTRRGFRAAGRPARPRRRAPRQTRQRLLFPAPTGSVPLGTALGPLA